VDCALHLGVVGGGKRILTTDPWQAYIKIAEGCDNCCSYCAIPAIRGSYRSRPMEELVEEAKDLAAQGVKELIVVAQDTTRYGEDIDLVYAMDDNLAIGAVEALRSAGLNGKIPVIGYNGMSDAFELIKSGEMYSTLIQPLYWGGGVAVQAMYDYLTGKEIEPAYYDTMVNVTAENVDELEPEW
jgi:ABC-type sugar transport system substrate-binding protein